MVKKKIPQLGEVTNNLYYFFRLELVGPCFFIKKEMLLSSVAAGKRPKVENEKRGG